MQLYANRAITNLISVVYYSQYCPQEIRNRGDDGIVLHHQYVELEEW